MVKHTNFSLCLDDVAAVVFCEPLAEIASMDNDDVIELIFSLYTQNETSSDSIFKKSIEHLVESDCLEYIVYRYSNEKRRFYESRDNWSIVMEISEENYYKLHPDICGKLRDFYRNSPKSRRSAHINS
ncbi:MAG: hypothetical protein AAGL34_11480 [Bacteroidota bacterium]